MRNTKGHLCHCHLWLSVIKSDYEVSLETSLHYLCVCVVCECEGMHCTVWLSLVFCFDGWSPWVADGSPACRRVITQQGSAHTNTTQLYALDHQHVDLFVWLRGRFFSFHLLNMAFTTNTLSEKRYKKVTRVVPFQKVHLCTSNVHIGTKSVPKWYVLEPF